MRRINDISCMLPLVQEPNSRSDVFGCTVAATHIYPPRTRCYSIDDMDGEAFVAFGGDGITLQRTYSMLDFRPMIGCMWGYLATIITYETPDVTAFEEPLPITAYTATAISFYQSNQGSSHFKYCHSN